MMVSAQFPDLNGKTKLPGLAQRLAAAAKKPKPKPKKKPKY